MDLLNQIHFESKRIKRIAKKCISYLKTKSSNLSWSAISVPNWKWYSLPMPRIKKSIKSFKWNRLPWIALVDFQFVGNSRPSTAIRLQRLDYLRLQYNTFLTDLLLHCLLLLHPWLRVPILFSCCFFFFQWLHTSHSGLTHCWIGYQRYHLQILLWQITGYRTNGVSGSLFHTLTTVHSGSQLISLISLHLWGVKLKIKPETQAEQRNLSLVNAEMRMLLVLGYFYNFTKAYLVSHLLANEMTIIWLCFLGHRLT